MEKRDRQRKKNWMKSVCFYITDSNIEGMHDLVRMGMYPGRSALIRAAIRDLLNKKLWKKTRHHKEKYYQRSRLNFEN